MGLHILLGLQDTPGAAITAIDVAALSLVDVPVRPVLDVPAAAGFLDDRAPIIDRWVATNTVDLPATMVTDLPLWLEVMRHGHTSPPRSKPRAPRAIQSALRWALPAPHAWAPAGHEHLREITRDKGARGAARLRHGAAHHALRVAVDLPAAQRPQTRLRQPDHASDTGAR